MDKKKLIDNFLKQLEAQHQAGSFGIFCQKCGSFNIEHSYDGEGGPVTEGSYTASFDGKHFIKCLGCGNSATEEFVISMNGAFE